MHAELIEKPIIIAICGKSAAGKDTLAKCLTKYFRSLGLYAHNMISATTRPPREGEKDGVDYYFINRQQFEDLIHKEKLVEFATFRGWYYGVPFSSVQSGYINIGVFNPQGLRTLQKYRYEYEIVPVYIEEKFSTRMRRSHDREGKWKIEFFRRAWTDYKDFKYLEEKVNLSNGRWVHIKEIDGLWYQCNIIKNAMIDWGIFIEDKDKKLRLGNFV